MYLTPSVLRTRPGRKRFQSRCLSISVLSVASVVRKDFFVCWPRRRAQLPIVRDQFPGPAKRALTSSPHLTIIKTIDNAKWYNLRPGAARATGHRQARNRPMRRETLRTHPL